jgi:hypothetical protein
VTFGFGRALTLCVLENEKRVPHDCFLPKGSQKREQEEESSPQKEKEGK